MEKFMILTLLSMSVFMFISTIVWGIAHLIMGTIGFVGTFMVLFFAFMTWLLMKGFWCEYQQQKNR